MEFKDSKTRQNLLTAYLRESGAFNEYSFYAMQAKTERLEKVANTFLTFAQNEQAHAKVLFKFWHGIGETKDNLKDAMDLENYERTVMYAEFSKIAKKEGFTNIAKTLDLIAKVEGSHEQQYKTLMEELKGKTMFKEKEAVGWKCLNCGHIHYGKQPPETCPLCNHPRTYFTKMPNEQN